MGTITKGPAMRGPQILSLLSLMLVAHDAAAGTTIIYIPSPVTIRSVQYTPSPYNLDALEPLRSAGVKLKVKAESQPPAEPGANLCRGWFPILPGDGASFATFVHEAFIVELKQAGVYSDSEGQEISLQLSSIDFSSGFSGSWSYQATVVNAKGETLDLSYSHGFDGSFAAASACRLVGEAFTPSVETFLVTLYRDSRFRKLVGMPE